LEYNRNYACRITDNLIINGIRAIVMENEKLRITVLIDKGTEIYEFLYKPLDIDFMWRSPVELQNPSVYVPSTGNDSGTYLDRSAGGWQEILPNGGPACEYKGARLGLHGEICNIPWKYSIIKDTSDEISIRFWVRTYRTAFYLEKNLTLKSGDTTLYIDETLKNEAAEDMELMWGHHPTVGAPFLSEDCVIRTSARKIIVDNEIAFPDQRLEPGSTHVWPIATDRNGNSINFSLIPSINSKLADTVYLTDFEGEAFYEIINKRFGVSFKMNWDKTLFKYLWMWQVCGGGCGYPWYGRTYSLALEPWTSYPSNGLNEAIRNGSALCLTSGEVVHTNMMVSINEQTA
jgi:hypothetical protein